MRYLESSKFCPICDVQVHKTRPLLHIRSVVIAQWIDCSDLCNRCLCPDNNAVCASCSMTTCVYWTVLCSTCLVVLVVVYHWLRSHHILIVYCGVCYYGRKISILSMFDKYGYCLTEEMTACSFSVHLFLHFSHGIRGVQRDII